MTSKEVQMTTHSQNATPRSSKPLPDGIPPALWRIVSALTAAIAFAMAIAISHPLWGQWIH